MLVKLIADSGSTKTEWCLLSGNKKKIIHTQGISPYFFTSAQIAEIIASELKPGIGKTAPGEIFFYGTGCSNLANIRSVTQAIKRNFPDSVIKVNHDLMGAARALCGKKKGIACILGTGSNSCYFNGTRIVKNSPGLGFILGDEGSGAYLGKKVVQYYLYNTFDEDLMDRFNAKFKTNAVEILASVYKEPLPNRYLGSFSIFLAENRGHYMIENIIEDGLNDFFFNHICKYRESWTLPIHFVGGVAWGFRDVVTSICEGYNLQLGTILQNPMEGLIQYHK